MGGGENMTEVKQWLSRAREIDFQLRALRDARAKTFDSLTNTISKYSSDGLQGTKDPHKYDRLVEINGIISQKEDELVQIRKEIIRVIVQIPNGNQRAVLLEYYFGCKTNEKIAEERGCSSKNVRNIRKKGELWIEKNL